MKRKIALLAVAGGLLGLYLLSLEDGSFQEDGHAGSVPTKSKGSEQQPVPSLEAPDAPSGRPGRRGRPGERNRAKAKARHEARVTAIRAALLKRAAAERQTPEGGREAKPTERLLGRSKEERIAVIQHAVQELKPLLVECYDLAAEDPNLGEGRLVVTFEIVGDPEVGGVIAESKIDDRSDLRHPLLDECVRESMYGLELPAPEGGGAITVSYPFQFRRKNPDATSQRSP